MGHISCQTIQPLSAEGKVLVHAGSAENEIRVWVPGGAADAATTRKSRMKKKAGAEVAHLSGILLFMVIDPLRNLTHFYGFLTHPNPAK
jgi:hypothetical protein